MTTVSTHDSKTTPTYDVGQVRGGQHYTTILIDESHRIFHRDPAWLRSLANVAAEAADDLERHIAREANRHQAGLCSRCDATAVVTKDDTGPLCAACAIDAAVLSPLRDRHPRGAA